MPSVKSCKAAILNRSNHPLVIDEIRLPERLHPGQILVQVQFAGVCGSQLGEIDAVKGPDPYLPHLLGHEGSGVVVEVARGVTRVSEGDRVVLHWRPAAGMESLPARYTWRGAPLNSGLVTTFNEFCVVSENRVTPIPEWVDMSRAPLLGCALTTAFGVLESDSQIKAGNSLLVLGAGGVGLAVVQAASVMRAMPIVVVDKSQSKLDAARTLGAQVTVLSSTPRTLCEMLKCETELQEFDVVVETTGHSDLISLSYDLASSRGTTVLVGVPSVEDSAHIKTLGLHFGKKIVGSHGGNSHPDLDIPRLLKLVEQGDMDLGAIPAEHRPLDEVNEALARLRGEAVGRQIITMGEL